MPASFNIIKNSMNKNILTAILFINCCLFASAQTIPEHLNSFRIAGINWDEGKYIDLDSAGNVYVAGLFGAACDFDPGPGNSTMTVSGNTDIFLAKYSPSGALLWKYPISGSDEFLFGLKVDAAGNAYIVGSYYGSLTAFGLSSNAGATAVSNADAFMIKYSADGRVKYMNSFGGNNSDELRSVTVDSLGNCYVGGAFYSANMDMDPGAGMVTLTNTTLNAVGNNPFIAKYDSTGNYVWALNLKNTRRGRITALQIDAAGRLVAGGESYGNITTDSTGSFIVCNGGSGDNVIMRFSLAGIYDMGWSFGGPDNDIIYDMAITGNDIVATGSFESFSDLDPGSSTHTINSTGDFGIYVVKIDENGAFQWGGAIQGPYMDEGHGIAVNPAGEVYVCGFFRDSVSFDLNGGANIAGHGLRDGFVAKYSATGNLITYLIVGGANSEECADIVHSGNGDFYITGFYYDDPIYMNPATPNVGLNNLGIYDAFVGHYSDNLVTVGVASIQSDDIKVYPVPANDYINIELKNTGNYSATILDVSGRIATSEVSTFTRNTSISTQSLANGIYLIAVSNENSEPVYFRFIKQ